MPDGRNEPVVLVASDSHVGPRLVEELRPYCPAKRLDAFDRFAKEAAAQPLAALRAWSR